MVPYKRTLLAIMDGLQEYTSDRYFSCGKTKIVEGRAGKYREAEGKPLSRFGYRFVINNIGRPHMAVIRYPDDKRRFMTINDGTSYDLSTGVTTGHAYPVSGEMKELQQIFWPRWQECSICFMTWGHNEPAAVQRVEIYELDDLPAAAIPNEHDRRELGIQYEDPCGTGASEGAMSFEVWLDRVISYSKYTGQSLLTYPICWYHGPWFPSQRERADAFSMVVAPDRNQYLVWTDKPEDWVGKLLARFEKEGLTFQGSLTLLRLSSLMAQMNVRLDAIKNGAGTINNMLWCDDVQAGTCDWTPIYNTLNYPNVLEKIDPLACKKSAEWAYGERTGQPYHPSPIFNPLHPVVQQAVVGLVREAAHRYGGFTSFKGISLNFWAPTIVWFGSLHAGYDDYTIGLFEKETGIRIPVEPNDHNRFSKRYEFMGFKCRSEWIAWRCRKIHQFMQILRNTLVSVRPDLRLVLTLWCEPFIPAVYGNGMPEHQIYSRMSTLDIFKNGGLDPALYHDQPNILLDFQTEGGGRDRSAAMMPNAPLEEFFMFRDHDFLDKDMSVAMVKSPNSGVFIFNAWHEAWGNHRWFPCKAGDPNVPAVSSVYGKRDAVNVFRINSEYPNDGFWWDSQLRITAAYPPAPHFMEQYAHAVAQMDACRITRGGLFLDKAHSEEIETFARAYRALPAEKFETVGTSTDPAAVRTLVKDGVRYLYMVNREYYPIDVELYISQPAGQVIDLVSRQKINILSPWNLTLRPYDLRSFSLQPSVMIHDYTLHIPPAIVQGLIEDARNAMAQIRQVNSRGYFGSGLDKMYDDIESALKERRWSWLRHALASYPVCKCKELLLADQDVL